jgi:hypothetical protein
MNLEDILKLDKLICTGEQARAGWYLDQDEIISAIDSLGITLQVRIRFMTGISRMGTHYAYEDHHKITVDQTLLSRSASHTIWHELVHAMQAERFVKETGKPITKFHHEAYRPSNGPWGASYKLNEMEIEANKIADSMTDYTLVIYPADRGSDT